jgi:hypothetical protein
MRSMVKHKAGWHAVLAGGRSSAASPLDELRPAKRAHRFLTEEVHRHEGIAPEIPRAARVAVSQIFSKRFERRRRSP